MRQAQQEKKREYDIMQQRTYKPAPGDYVPWMGVCRNVALGGG